MLSAAVAVVVLVSGCNEARGAASKSANARPGPSGRGTDPRAAKPTNEALAQIRGSAKPYTADFAAAVAKVKGRPSTDSASFGGMACAPDAINGDPRALTLTLPESAEARRHVLAVVTPQRGLLEIYSPYGDETEPENLILPSMTITWAKVRAERRFSTSSDALSGLRPGSDTPEPLFIEPGRYRFALVNGIDAELLKANRPSVVVYAACSLDWTP